MTPLTTYMYTTDIQDGGTVSATDEERLPPGGFSLRHGFPAWFGRASRSAASSRQTSGSHPQTPRDNKGKDMLGSPGSVPSISSSRLQGKTSQISIYEILHYLRSTFDDAEVLDGIPLDAAGNPGAWHAWRSYRSKLSRTLPVTKSKASAAGPEALREGESGVTAPRNSSGSSTMTTRKPGEWNWEGVWEFRVKKGLENSLSESVLFGSTAGGDDLVCYGCLDIHEEHADEAQIHFLNMDDDHVQSVKENLIRSVESTAI